MGIKVSDTNKLKSVNVATGNAKSKIIVNSGSKGEASFNLSLAGGKLEYEVTGNSDGDTPPANKKIKKYSDFGVVVYKKKTKTLSVTVVNDSVNNLIVPANHQFQNIQSNMNFYYKQALIEWDVAQTKTVDINYDSDTDGYLGTGERLFLDKFVVSFTEFDIIYTNSQVKDDTKDINMFIVKNVATYALLNILTVNGIVPDVNNNKELDDKYVFISSDLGDIQTIAHELGHTQGLRHIDKDQENLFSILIKHRRNIMAAASAQTQDKFLKQQWDKLHK